MGTSLIARSARHASVLAAAAAVALTIGASSAQAAIAKVQTGAEASGTGNSITATLPAASTAGNLLVAVLANGNTTSSNVFSGSSGWVNATGVWLSGDGRVEIWYRANNPGGITSATFTTPSSGGEIIGELTEWSGVALSSPLDRTGTKTSTSVSSSTVSTSASTVVSNELGITAFTTSAAQTFTAGSGWSHVFSDGSRGVVADSRTGLSNGAISETQTGTTSASWADVIATFKPACTGGSLTLATPGSASFSAVTLNGTNQTATASVVITPDDESGNGSSWSGWNVTGTSTTLNDGSGHNFSPSATSLATVSASAATGNCALPTNSIGYPVTLPAGSTPPTAVKLYNAAANTGAGPTNVTLNFSLFVPANSFRGTYTSTWTLAIVSGP